MVDWEAVERLRSKGWDWDRIAGDPRVGFRADAGLDEPGRALKALYYQRRSKSKRRSTGGAGGGKGAFPEERERRWTLARIGYVATPVFGVWFLLAYLFPSPVGVYITAIPVLALLLAVAAFLLAFGLLRSPERWTRVYRNTLVGGLIVGMVISGGLAVVGVSQNCPSLSPSRTSEPGTPLWYKSPNSPWQSNGVPVLFFYGSIACPYCSASSWPIVGALQRFGSVSGIQYGHSSVTDSPSAIAEVYLYTISVQSPFIAIDILEGTDDSTPVGPPTSNCVQQAYVSAYDTSGGIPFVALNGIYTHVGSFVDPTQLQGYTAAQVQQEMSNQSGNAWNAISPSMYWLEAYIVHVNGGHANGVENDPNVKADLSQIS